MRPAAQSLPIRQPDIHALGGMRMIQARVPAALLACAAGFVLGPPKDNAFHPWASARSVVSQRHRIIACASTSSLARDPAPPESIGSTAKSPRTQARITGSIVSALSSAAKIARHFLWADHVDRAPLMRFASLQHIRPRMRCPGRPASGRSRFGLG